MPTVSNTSPILNLAIIGHLVLLREQFEEILIPPAVVKELRPEEDLPGCDAVRGAREEGWFRVEEVKDRSLVQVLRRDVDEGEAEAIALALQVEAEWILMDQREARRIAKSLGLKVTGVLGILRRASREGKLPSLQVAMEQLREKAGFHIGADLFADLLKEIGERKT